MSDDNKPSWEKAEELRTELLRVEIELKKLGIDAYNAPEEAAYRANTYQLQRLRLEDESGAWRDEYRAIVRLNAQNNERQTAAIERIAAALEAKR